MKRALIVVMVALLIASVAGVNDTSLALEREAPQASGVGEREIALRVSRIEVGRVVRIERVDGSRSDAVLDEVLPDAIVVTVLEKEHRRRETIPFAEIRKIDEIRGHALRNVLIGVGIGVALLVGACAATRSSETTVRITS